MQRIILLHIYVKFPYFFSNIDFKSLKRYIKLSICFRVKNIKYIENFNKVQKVLGIYDVENGINRKKEREKYS